MQTQLRLGRAQARASAAARSGAARRAAWRCRAAAPQTADAATAASSKGRLLYDAVALDMDGTLTQAHIDFVDMRQRTGIPVGDLFVVMESWEEPERVAAAMDVILEIEAEASKTVRAMPGLFELLATLREHDVKVALVTRNTTASVDAFFRLIGEEWRGAFDAIRTREFRYVKPDKRLLLSLAADLGARPGHVLMVGDSLEDVECGNAAGTASCLIAGGGNEVGAANAPPPPGAVPTIKVHSLLELNQILLDTKPGGDSSTGAGDVGDAGDALNNAAAGSSTAAAAAAAAGAEQLLGWRARVAGGEDPAAVAAALMDPLEPGAPAPGLEFADWLIGMNALCIASTSFPRMGAAAGGLQACPLGGHSVLHLECGGGALTKMLASKGLVVCGADAQVDAAARRGLACFAYGGSSGGGGGLAAGALEGAAARGPFDVVLYYEPASSGSSSGSGSSVLGAKGLLAVGSLGEVRRVLAPGGRLCAEVEGGAGAEGRVRSALEGAGWRVDVVAAAPGGRLRVVAQAA